MLPLIADLRIREGVKMYQFKYSQVEQARERVGMKTALKALIFPVDANFGCDLNHGAN